MKICIPVSFGITALLGLTASAALGQGFNSGSDGSNGALNVTESTTLPVPPNGQLHFTTISVNAGATLRFTRNALNTPVYLLATGDVIVEGTIDVSGESPTRTSGGAGGPGGFDGGKPEGVGYGPGGGRPSVPNVSQAGPGAYGTASGNENRGAVYGSPLLVPLVGGSGGGGSPDPQNREGAGGGGGGGAILIASNTRIEVRSAGAIRAEGGPQTLGGGHYSGSGSGGAIRLLAPVVAGNGLLAVQTRRDAGRGRIRIDAIDRTGINFNHEGSPNSIGNFMTVFPPGNPKLDIIQAADTSIPENNPDPVTINLPFGSDPNRTVVVQARNYNAALPIEVVLTPDAGPQVRYAAAIDNTAANPATAIVNVTFPVNTPVAVHAWTR